MNHGISNLGQRHTFSQGKPIEKINKREKINTDTINWEIYLKNIEKRQILTQSIEKSFLIDPLTTNNAIYRDSLTLSSTVYWANQLWQIRPKTRLLKTVPSLPLFKDKNKAWRCDRYQCQIGSM